MANAMPSFYPLTGSAKGEGEESILKRGIFLIMGLIILAYYLQFLKTVVRRRMGRRSRDEARY